MAFHTLSVSFSWSGEGGEFIFLFWSVIFLGGDFLFWSVILLGEDFLFCSVTFWPGEGVFFGWGVGSGVFSGGGINTLDKGRVIFW